MGTLKMGTIFATWMKDRIRQYGFVEGLDFVTFSVIPENGGRRVEYYGTLSMGKELAMVENNDRGRTSLVRLPYLDGDNLAPVPIPALGDIQQDARGCECPRPSSRFPALHRAALVRRQDGGEFPADRGQGVP
jgi:hypothetical protein